MKIETKFDVGQKVWKITSRLKTSTCSHCGGECSPMSSEWVIEEGLGIVAIEVLFSELYTAEHYTLRGGRKELQYDIFPTKAEAQAAADKRNKEKSK